MVQEDVMNTNKNLKYGVVALVAAGIALVAGVPRTFCSSSSAR